MKKLLAITQTIVTLFTASVIVNPLIHAESDETNTAPSVETRSATSYYWYKQKSLTLVSNVANGGWKNSGGLVTIASNGATYGW